MTVLATPSQNAPQRTPFYQCHLDNSGKIVDFSGWELPIHYGSQIKEHDAVRTDAGMFDVSHMVVTDITGDNAKAWLQKLLANDIAKAKFVGKAIYSAMLNEQGGVIDDLIAYRMNEAETEYRIVSNAATRDKDLAQFEKVGKDFGVTITERHELAMLAVQGPNAIEKLAKAKPTWAEVLQNLTPFVGADLTETEGKDWFVAKTGYTGEDGVEVILPQEQAGEFFTLLKDNGITPTGLGARDTLRLEAGMNLYGHEMDETITPYECGMAWTLAVKDDRDFIGRKAMQDKQAKAIAEGNELMQIGVVLEGRGVLREGMTITLENGKTGITTSGTFSPSLKHAIAIARIPKTTDTTAMVDIRGTQTPVRLVPLPFVRNGKKQFE